MISFFFSKLNGRNNRGRVTVRHRGGGTRFKIPNVSFKSPSVGFNLSYKLTTVNTSFGFSDLFVSPGLSDSTYNTRFSNSYSFSSISGKVLYTQNIKPLFLCSIGQYISFIENRPGYGPKFSKAAGSFSQILRKRGSRATLRLPSGEIRRVSILCSALVVSTVDRVSVLSTKRFCFSNAMRSSYNRAGFSRFFGVRPHVRGCAINPVDHPHGGRTGESRPSVSPWGQLTKGYRTRTKKINRRSVILSVQDFKNRARL